MNPEVHMQYTASAQPPALPIPVPSAADLKPLLSGARAVGAISALFLEHAEGRLDYYHDHASGQWKVRVLSDTRGIVPEFSLMEWAMVYYAALR
jgi:hypothetical protein